MSKTCIAVDTTCIFHRILLDDDVKDGGGREWACIAVDWKSRNLHNHIVVVLRLLLDDDVKDGGGEWPGVKNRLGGRVPSQLTSATSLHLVL